MGNFTVLICSICCSVIVANIYLNKVINVLIEHQTEYLEEVKKVTIEVIKEKLLQENS